MSGIMAMLLGAVSSVITDAYFNLVTLLLPGNGTNGAQNNTFLDSSTNNFTITRNGNTTQGTFSPFSQTGWSNFFDGTGDYLSIASGMNVGTSDFTIESWVFPTVWTVEYTSIFSTRATNSTSGATDVWVLGVHNTGYPYIYSGAFQIQGSAGQVVLNTWTHLAVSRSGSTMRLFVNGTLVQTSTTSQNYTQGAGAIGANRDGSEQWTGYLSNLRLVSGTAVYTSSFTPPTTPLTAITNTSLLTCQSNRFIDNSSNAFTITRNGDVSVQAFSPFAPTAAYSAATVGGSGYFDGTGDFLTSSHPDMNATWTIETWIYRSSGGVNQCIAMMNNGGFSGVFIFINTSNYIEVNNGVSAVGAFTNVSVPIRAWTHIAVVRSGGTTTGYINGAVAGSNTFTPSTVSAARIGQYHGGDNMFFTGYISNFRVVNGTAVYTSAFTPPTAPLTAVTNTSLLVNFTNAGITDATAKNVLETVGNAQISTTQSKFGVSSISFDGTGDWLLLPHTVDQFLSTGAFTIEMWVYRNASGTYGLVGKGTATTGWLVSLNSSNQVVFTHGSTTITSTGTISSATWTYIAVVREGTGTNQTKIYINGTNDGTGTVSTDFNQTNSMYVGADRTGGSAFNGYIDDLRITRGFARTVTTTPTAAFALQ